MSEGLERLWAGWRSSYIEGIEAAPAVAGAADSCLFGRLLAMDDVEALILERTPSWFAVMNAYPYTSGHVMVAPVRHVASITDLDATEAGALMHGVQRATRMIESVYRPEGINVGANIGRAAGAGVPGHVHVHVLPRWNGDTNFMTAVAEARVLPESLRHSYEKLHAAWP
ncbi:MAG: HIT domain-containing protein [Acidimicrobiia bacterium]